MQVIKGEIVISAKGEVAMRILDGVDFKAGSTAIKLLADAIAAQGVSFAGPVVPEQHRHDVDKDNYVLRTDALKQ